MYKKSALVAVWLIACSMAHGGGVVLQEDFDNVAALPSQGWTLLDLSDFPSGPWSQGDPGQFPAHQGAPAAYVMTDPVQQSGNLSCNWLIFPNVGHMDAVRFFARARLFNSKGGPLDIGELFLMHSPLDDPQPSACLDRSADGTALGDFVVLDSVTAGQVADAWFEINVPINAGGRFALLYYSLGGDDAIATLGVDSVTITGNGAPPQAVVVPTLGSVALWCLALLMLPLAWVHRAQRMRR